MSLNDIIKLIIEAIIKAIAPKPQPPTPTPPTPTPTPPSSDFVTQLLQLHNTHRQSRGLGILTLNTQLNNASQKHSNWMLQNKTLNHFEGSKGPGDRITAEGYRWSTYGENIASGYATPQAVFQGWLNSSGHRANIENSRFKDVGFGVAGKYWTAGFASKVGTPAMSLPGGLKGEE